MAEFWYNSSYHSALSCTPFKALYGYDPPFAAAPVLQEVADKSVEELLSDRLAHLEMLKEQLARAQNRMKHKADRNCSERQFSVGEMVLLKLQPYAQKTVVNRLCPKLAFKYFGPYMILEKIGPVAYRLELPPEAQAHPVFHISQLKPFTPNYTHVFAELRKMVHLDEVELEPGLILDRRLVKKGNQEIPQVLVKWSHLDEDSATWEDYNVVKHRFPEAVAWGQATFGEGGDVTPDVQVTE